MHQNLMSGIFDKYINEKSWDLASKCSQIQNMKNTMKVGQAWKEYCVMMEMGSCLCHKDLATHEALWDKMLPTMPLIDSKYCLCMANWPWAPLLIP